MRSLFGDAAGNDHSPIGDRVSIDKRVRKSDERQTGRRSFPPLTAPCRVSEWICVPG